MKLKILSAILSFSCLSSIAYAAESSYRAEVAAGYGQYSIDGTDMFNKSEYDISGVYYFSGVDTKSHPLAEAAFVERSSNIYARWNRVDYDNFGSSLDVSAIGIDFYVPSTMLYIGAGIEQLNGKNGIETYEDSAWYAKLGIAPIDGLLVWSQFYEDADVSDYWNINAKYVVPLSGENAINFEARYANWDDQDSDTEISADYYFTRNFSLGAGYTISDSVDTIELRARHFFGDKFSMEVGYATEGSDDNSWRLGANLRF